MIRDFSITSYFLFNLPCNTLPLSSLLQFLPCFLVLVITSIPLMQPGRTIHLLTFFLDPYHNAHPQAFCCICFCQGLFLPLRWIRISSLSSSIAAELLLTNLIIYFFVKQCPLGISPVHPFIHLSSLSDTSSWEILSPLALSLCLWISTLLPLYPLFSWSCLIKYLKLLCIWC